MNKPEYGDAIKTLRIPDDLWAEIGVTIERRNRHSSREPWVWSQFCLTVIRREIAKMKRSREQGGGKGRRRVVSQTSSMPIPTPMPMPNA